MRKSNAPSVIKAKRGRPLKTSLPVATFQLTSEIGKKNTITPTTKNRIIIEKETKILKRTYKKREPIKIDIQTVEQVVSDISATSENITKKENVKTMKTKRNKIDKPVVIHNKCVWYCEECKNEHGVSGNNAMAPFFKKCGWKCNSIARDGDCLFNAVAQAESNGQKPTKFSVLEQRQHVAERLTVDTLESYKLSTIAFPNENYYNFFRPQPAVDLDMENSTIKPRRSGRCSMKNKQEQDDDEVKEDEVQVKGEVQEVLDDKVCLEKENNEVLKVKSETSDPLKILETITSSRNTLIDKKVNTQDQSSRIMCTRSTRSHGKADSTSSSTDSAIWKHKFPTCSLQSDNMIVSTVTKNMKNGKKKRKKKRKVDEDSKDVVEEEDEEDEETKEEEVKFSTVGRKKKGKKAKEEKEFVTLVQDLDDLKKLFLRLGAEYGPDECLWADEFAVQLIANLTNLAMVFIDIERGQGLSPYRLLACSESEPSHLIVLKREGPIGHYSFISKLNGESCFRIDHSLPCVIPTLWKQHIAEMAEKHEHVARLYQRIFEPIETKPTNARSGELDRL